MIEHARQIKQAKQAKRIKQAKRAKQIAHRSATEKDSPRRRIRRGLAAALAAVLLLSGCTALTPATVAVRRDGKAPKVDTAGGGPHIVMPIPAGAAPAASSNYLSLYLDEASMNIIVRGFPDTAFKTDWTSLGQDSRYPQAGAGACAAEITAIVHGERITLNTQDHSVAYGRAISEKIENGMRVRYFLYPNRETAAKPEPDTGDVAFVLGISYTLRNGNFYVEADWDNHSGNPDAFIESIGLMERFGALRQPGPDDFLLLPDGSGALLYPARKSAAPDASETGALRFSVYGGDPALGGDGAPLAANLGAFGAYQRQTAFLAVIEQGASVAAVTARQSLPGEIAQSSVGARFLITPTTLPEDGAPKGAILRAAKSYAPGGGKPGIKICYRFFFGDNANYSTMAVACREELIGCNMISSTKSVDHPEKGLPLNLTILGSMPDGAGGLKALSRFDETLDVLSRLWRADVASMNIRYLGAMTGGLRQAEPEALAPLARLNGRSGLAELREFCAANALDLFLEANLLPLGGRRKSQQALALDGAPLSARRAEPFAALLGLESESVALRGVKRVDHSVLAVLRQLGKLGVTGVSVGDVGGLLYSDYADGGMTREEAAQYLAQYMPSLSAQWRVMLDTGYFHIIRTADVVMELPLDTQVKMKAANRYVAVPFLQILLHGSMDYSGAALNLAQDPEEAFLRMVEFGACPAFTWYCAKADAPSDEKLLFTGEQQDAAAALYARANKALGDLRGARILRHSRIKGLAGDTKGVTATEYGTGAAVYVNYNDAPVTTVTGVIVPARGFARTG